LKDQSVKIKNLGSFKLIVVSERESVDVVTGNRMVIPEHYKINFVPDSGLAQAVNEPFQLFETVELDENPAPDTPVAMESEVEAEVETEPETEPEPEAETTVQEELQPEKTEETPVPLGEATGMRPKISETQPVSHFRWDPSLLQSVEKTDFHEKRKKRKRKDVFATLFCVAVLLIACGLLTYFYFWEKPDPLNTLETLNYPNVPYSRNEALPVAGDSLNAKPLEETRTNVPDTLSNRDKSYTLRRGDRLTLIALHEYGHKVFWVYLYEENKAILKNPDHIPAGLTIRIPPASKYGIDRNDADALQKARELQKRIQQN
jgi:nucleoid-associated protein YgaU